MCDHSMDKPMSSTLLWCCLFFNFTQFVFSENLSVLDLALSGVIRRHTNVKTCLVY